ncbi:MAG: hypothetical protein Q7T33_01055 [Dehalococcoidia bacterium]|nr:hypothetical protein [Dehalococcoidia bacterium]
MLLTSATAAANSVYIAPASATAGAGQPAVVDLVAEPAGGGLAAWVLEVGFDPAVISTASRQCDPVDTPAGAAGAVGCEAADTNGDGQDDAVKTFGGVIFTNTGKGFTQKVTLASIEFNAVGEAGACSALTVKVTAFSDPDGNETSPSIANGEVCVAGPGRTPGPSPTPGVDPGSPAATAAPGATDGGIPGATASPGPGQTTPQGTGGASGAAGSPGAGTGGGSPSPGGPRGGTAGQAGEGGGGGSGPGTAVWALIGLGAAAAVGGGGFAAYRAWRARKA